MSQTVHTTYRKYFTQNNISSESTISKRTLYTGYRTVPYLIVITTYRYDFSSIFQFLCLFCLLFLDGGTRNLLWYCVVVSVYVHFILQKIILDYFMNLPYIRTYVYAYEHLYVDIFLCVPVWNLSNVQYYSK